MTMKIKPGDVVEYLGKQVRVMDVTNNQSGFPEWLRLSHFNYNTAISANDVKLVESIPEPTIKIMMMSSLSISQKVKKNVMGLVGVTIWINWQHQVPLTK